LAFNLQQSDLPLRPAFPLLLANLVTYLTPGVDALIPTALTPGEALSISVPSQVTHLRLVGPTGTETIVAAEAGRVGLPPLKQPGLYTLTFEPSGSIAPADLAVNFFDPLESAIAPQFELNFTGPTPAGVASTPLPSAHQEWWRPIALGALMLLVVEWFVYQRSAVFKWWNVLRWRVAGGK
jgi:hypothetical protein